jgi:Mitochondrial carrier protein
VSVLLKFLFSFSIGHRMLLLTAYRMGSCFPATFASIVIHPIDLAKVRMQIHGQLYPGTPVPSFPSIITGMVRNTGVLSIYRGVDAAIGRQLVYGTARIGLHRKFSDRLVEMNAGNPISFVQKSLSGMASGSVAVCIGTPFDIALVRLQSEGRGYKNVFDALIRTAKEEGVGALYHGLAPNVLRGMSMVRYCCSMVVSPTYCCFPHLCRLPTHMNRMSECWHVTIRPRKLWRVSWAIHSRTVNQLWRPAWEPRQRLGLRRPCSVFPLILSKVVSWRKSQIL